MLNYELHTHLGGATPLDTTVKIATREGYDHTRLFSSHDEFVDAMLGRNNRLSYFDRYRVMQEICSTPSAVEISVYETLMDLVERGTTYTELRFNPILRNINGKYDIREMIDAAVRGLHSAQQDANEKDPERFLQATLTIESDRTFTVEQTSCLFDCVASYGRQGECSAVDISGHSDTFDIAENLPVLRKAKERGLNITLHYGETDHDLPRTDKQRETFIEVLKTVDRIGHGIIFLRDDFCREQLLKYSRPLEICYTSNIKNGVFSSPQEAVEVLNGALEAGVDLLFCSDGHIVNGTAEQNVVAIHEEIARQRGIRPLDVVSDTPLTSYLNLIQTQFYTSTLLERFAFNYKSPQILKADKRA